MDKKNPSQQKPQQNPKQQQPQKPGQSSTKNPAHKKDQF